MAFSYADWPTSNNIVSMADSVDGVDPHLLSRDIVDAIRAAVTRQIQQITRRQFIPATATRYFDGSGTGTQKVDEYVSVTTVTITGYTGATPLTLANWYAEEDNLYPKTTIAIFQGGPPSYGFGYYTAFPSGRKNIGVTANWGYAATIPADLWLAHLEESAARVAAIVVANADGRRVSYTVADAISEKFDLSLPGKTVGWHDRFEPTVRDYVNPKVHTPPARKAVMI